MVLITQVWSTELNRYVEDELTLRECLPSTVREGLAIRGLPTGDDAGWEDLAQSA
jgi:hypothetical protein